MSLKEVLQQDLKTAMKEKDSIVRAVSGEKIGTLIS